MKKLVVLLVALAVVAVACGDDDDVADVPGAGRVRNELPDHD